MTPMRIKTEMVKKHEGDWGVGRSCTHIDVFMHREVYSYFLSSVLFQLHFSCSLKKTDIFLFVAGRTEMVDGSVCIYCIRMWAFFFWKRVVVDGGFVRTAGTMSVRRELKLGLKEKKIQSSGMWFICKHWRVSLQRQTNTNKRYSLQWCSGLQGLQ